MNAFSTPAAQLAGSLLIAAAVVVAFAIGDDLGSALAAGGVVAAFALLVYFGRRRSIVLPRRG
jgi:O-antigen/teichoic acid export membrane protein